MEYHGSCCDDDTDREIEIYSNDEICDTDDDVDDDDLVVVVVVVT